MYTQHFKVLYFVFNVFYNFSWHIFRTSEFFFPLKRKQREEKEDGQFIKTAKSYVVHLQNCHDCVQEKKYRYILCIVFHC